MVYPDGRNCTRGQTCLSVFQARRQNNVDSIAAVTAIMESTNTSYLIKSLSPDGEKHGVYSKPVVDCLPDQPCPPATRHGYFETSPNVDAIALNVVSKDLKKDFYDSMQSINGISPCGFTVPNFPDYDDAACTAENVGNCYVYGTWVSGGSWSTLEGRVILAHIDQRRYDLALASMSRIIYPYAELFKLDNPIAHMGCGPGMYGQGKGKEVSEQVFLFFLNSFEEGRREIRATTKLTYIYFPTITSFCSLSPPGAGAATDRRHIRHSSGLRARIAEREVLQRIRDDDSSAPAIRSFQN